MHAWILDDLHCPSGNANDSFSKGKHDDELPWEIKEAHLDVCGPITDGSITVDYYLNDKKDEIVGIVAVKHIPDSDKLSGEYVNLTDNIHDGMV